MNCGVNINFIMEDGSNFFLKVCEKGYNNIVKLLLYNGVDVNFRRKDGIIFFYCVC